MIGGQYMYEESLRCGQVSGLAYGGHKQPRVDVTVYPENAGLSSEQKFSQRFVVSRSGLNAFSLSIDDGREQSSVSTITVTREGLQAIMQALGSV